MGSPLRLGGCVLGLVESEAVAIEISSEKLVGRAPEIKSKLAKFEITKAALDEVLVRLKVKRPLLEGEEIAPAVVVHLHQLELGLGELVEQIVEHEEGVIAGIDMAHHERRQLVFFPRRAAVEEHEAARLQQLIELLQHPLVVGQMLDHAHDHNRFELLAWLEVVEVGEQDVEPISEIGELALEIGLRHIRIGDAGEAHAGLQRMPGKGAPTWAELQHALSRAKLAFLDHPVELALQSLGERLVVMGVDALAVGRERRIEKAQEQLRVGVVVRGDGALVGIDLAEQQRLYEAPCLLQRMAIVERGAERERLEHVALEIDVALQISLGDIALIERAQRLKRALVAEPDAKLFLAEADLALFSARQLDGERRRKSAQAINEKVERGSG